MRPPSVSDWRSAITRFLPARARAARAAGQERRRVFVVPTGGTTAHAPAARCAPPRGTPPYACRRVVRAAAERARLRPLRTAARGRLGARARWQNRARA
jgi:hypothetical protein